MEASDMTEAAPVETNRTRRRPRVLRLGSVLRREDGVTAIEFALLAPLLAIGLLALSAVAVWIQHRANLDQILRAGTHAAMQDMGHSEVLARMRKVAEAKGYIIADTATRDQLVLTSAANCACPGSLNVSRVCNTACPDDRPALRRYSITAYYISGQVRDLKSALWGLKFGGHMRLPDIILRKQVLVR
jgi:hypothetical protein